MERRVKVFNEIRQPGPTEALVDRTAINILQELGGAEKKREHKIPLIDVQGTFLTQKHKVEEMIRAYIKVEGRNSFDFTSKYDNLLEYFKERFKLANMQVGDDQINEFLRVNRLNIEVLMAKEQKEALHSTDQEKKYLKDLNPKNFISECAEDQNANTLKKILKVN